MNRVSRNSKSASPYHLIIPAILSIAIGTVGGCVSYQSISRHESNVYLAGSSGFMMFGSSWVKKCVEHVDEEGNPQLSCRKLKVADPVVLTDEMVLKTVWHDDWGWKCFRRPQLERLKEDIIIQVDVATTGHVTYAAIQSETLASTKAGTCIVDSLRNLTFPLVESSRTVYISLSPQEVLEVHSESLDHLPANSPNTSLESHSLRQKTVLSGPFDSSNTEELSSSCGSHGAIFHTNGSSIEGELVSLKDGQLTVKPAGRCD